MSQPVLPGTLDLLILKAASLGQEHGYGLLLRIQTISGGALSIEQGALRNRPEFAAGPCAGRAKSVGELTITMDPDGLQM